MAYYTKDELQAVLLKLANEGSDYKNVKHEKLGVVFTLASDGGNDLYSCGTCKKTLLSSHLLNIHFAEHHDTFFQLQKDKKPSVSC